MNPAVFIPCGEPGRDGEARGQILTVPCAAAHANHDSETPTRVAIPRHREPVRDRIRVGARAGALGNLEKPIVGLSLDTTNPARIKFIRSLKALRSLSSRPSIKFLAEQSRGKAPVRHVDFLSVDPCLHFQNAAGVTHEAGNIVQARGIFSQAGGGRV